MDVGGGRAKSEQEAGSGGLAAMSYGEWAGYGLLVSDTGWVGMGGRGQEGAGRRGEKRSEGDGSRVSSSTIEDGRFQSSSPGLAEPSQLHGACDSTAVSYHCRSHRNCGMGDDGYLP